MASQFDDWKNMTEEQLLQLPEEQKNEWILWMAGRLIEMHEQLGTPRTREPSEPIVSDDD